MTSSGLPQTKSGWHLRIWSLTWPVILANITIPLVGVADVAIMGRLPDPAYIAAVAMGSAMFSAVYWLFGFLRMGSTGLTAQALGRNAVDEITAICFRGSGVAAVLGMLIVLLQWPLEWLLFSLFEATPQVAALAGEYYNIRIFGAPGLLIYLVELGVLFGLQKMRMALVLSVGLNLTNLTLDILLVQVAGMGVAGVATGTVISEIGAAAAGWWLVRRELARAGWSGNLAGRLWQPQALRAFFHISGNLVIRTFFVQMPFFVGTVVATALGELTLAAHGVLMQLFFVMVYSLDGFAHTAETLAGFAYGARQPRGLRQTTVYTAFWAMLLAVATGLLYLNLGEMFVHFLSLDADVRRTATDYLPWVAVAPLLCVWAFLFDGIFIGTTHIIEMRNAMFVSALLWAFLLWLSHPVFGYHAVWLSMCVFMLARSALMGLYYSRIERAATSLVP